MHVPTTLRTLFQPTDTNWKSLFSPTRSLISEPAQLYTCLLDLEDSGDESNKVILCCLSKRNVGLELFIQELDAYAERLRGVLRKFVSC